MNPPKRIRNSILCACTASAALFAMPPAARAAITLPTGYTDTKIAGGLNPTIMMFAPDGRLFVNEKDGQIRVIKDGALLPAPFASVATDPFNEQGLLGIDFDPDFGTNHYVYVFYTTKAAPKHNRISRFTASGDVAAGPETVIFDITDLSDAGNHNGGTIQFGKDGKLYIASGNNANNAFSQSNANLLGKMLRINRDGTIPDDNPFTALTGKHRAIWALGFRNPFTFAIQPGTGKIYVNDVGGGTVEEVDDLAAGTNLGWPNIEGNSGTPPSGPGVYKGPLLTYTHDGSNCAITGGTFYNPPASTFPKEFTGRYFYADFCGGWIKAWDPEAKASSDFASGIAGPINIKAGPDGQLYYLARGTSKSGAAANTGTTLGEVHRIKGPINATVGLSPARSGVLTGYAVAGAGYLRLAWPAGMSVASIYTTTGLKIRELSRSADGSSDIVRVPRAAGLYHVRYRP